MPVRIRRSARDWSEIFIDAGSLFATGWLLVLFVTIPNSDPRSFTVFIAVILITILGRALYALTPPPLFHRM